MDKKERRMSFIGLKSSINLTVPVICLHCLRDSMLAVEYDA